MIFMEQLILFYWRSFQNLILYLAPPYFGFRVINIPSHYLMTIKCQSSFHRVQVTYISLYLFPFENCTYST